MMSDNMKQVPEIRFKGYTDAWEQRKLGEVAQSFDYGLNVAAIDFDGENKYIRITDIDEETQEFKTEALTSPDVDITTADNYRLQEGDILFARTGASVGKTYRYIKSDGLVYFAGFLIRARIKQQYDVDFVFQNTLTEKYCRFITITSQRSGQPGVNAQEYADFAMSAPTLSEQTAIGEFFRTLDATITLHQRKLDGLRELKKGYLQQMFPQSGERVPRVRFVGFSGEWQEKKWGEVVHRISAQSNSTNLPKVEYEDIVSGEGVLNKDVSQKLDKRKGVVFEPGNILYGKLRPYLKNWLLADFKGIALGDFWVFQSINSSPDFIYYLMQSEKYQEAANLSTGTKMPRSDWKVVSEVLFLIPYEIQEQAAIGNFFRTLDSQIIALSAKMERLKELKSAYLRKMFI